jgi:hypothetical protein
VLAHEQLVHPREEEARFGPLDDPMVVGRGQGDDLGHPELGEGCRVGGGELRRVGERADADDGALPGHEAGHRLGRAERAGVRDGDRHAGEVLDGQLVRADLAHELLVGVQEAGEVQLVGTLHAGDDEGA